MLDYLDITGDTRSKEQAHYCLDISDTRYRGGYALGRWVLEGSEKTTYTEKKIWKSSKLLRQMEPVWKRGGGGGGGGWGVCRHCLNNSYSIPLMRVYEVLKLLVSL